MTIRISFAFAAIFVALLCGCGQTGPLYLPGEPGEAQPASGPDDGRSQDEADDDD